MNILNWFKNKEKQEEDFYKKLCYEFEEQNMKLEKQLIKQQILLDICKEKLK